ncbi:MAG TPA: hypothetical protein VH413_15615 [Verrucomicrobiae bacterium]|nr:hypothetical protein [Verrucomicrobiae bacterium]
MQPIQSTVTEVWRFPLGAILPLVAISGMFLVLGIIFLREKTMRGMGAFFLMVSVVAGTVFLPSKVRERIIVAPNEFSVNNSFWFAQKHQGFAYGKVRLVRFRTVGRNAAWQVDYKDGHSETMECTKLCLENYTNILKALEHRGVSFRNDVIGD